jgi:hypothetical protein
MKKILVLAISLLIIVSCKFDLSKIVTATLYFIDGFEGSKLTDDELININSYKYNNDEIKELTKILSQNNLEKINDFVLWKGSKLVIIQMSDGYKIKIAISNYGNFIKFINYYYGTYELLDYHEEWEKLINYK